jgi:hypothetical protein
MPSLDTLAPDQRAVLDLVLQRGRSYDDIARLLAIDRAAVRARALAAFDMLGPDTGVAPESRALITDYLLGQLPTRVAEQTRDRLAASPDERAWARVLASEIGSVAANPLPEIPDGTARARGPANESEAVSPARSEAASPPGSDSDSPARADGELPARADGATPATGEPKFRRDRRRRPSDRPSSRLGGAILLLLGAILAVAVVVVLVVVLSSGGSKHPTGAEAAATSATTPPSTSRSPAGTGTGTGTTGTNAAKIVSQVNLNPPGGTGAAKGVAFIVQAGSAFGVIIQAQGLAPNSHNAYAVWLSNTPTDSTRVGFVNQAVGKTGRLETGGQLPANASHYKDLLLTLETQNTPKTPGPTILQGALTGVS